MKKAKFDGGKNGTFAGDDFGSFGRKAAAAGGTGIKSPQTDLSGEAFT